MRLLITGATGFLGQYVVRALLADGHSLTIAGTSMARLKQVFDGIQAHLIKTNYTVEDLAQQTLGTNFDAVIHLAAKRLDANGMLSDFSENIRITENLLRWSEEHGIGRIIMASSQSVYRNGINNPPFHEEDAYRLGQGKAYGYAYSKYICEQVAHFYKTPMISLRLGQLLGWGEKEGFMFSTQLAKVQKGEPIVLWGEGGGGRDYLYCKDAVQAIKAALEQPNPHTEVYNISMGKPISFLEFASTLVQVFGDEKSIIQYDKSKTEDRSIRYMCLDKAAKELLWRPQYNLEETFKDMKREYEIYHH